MKVLLWDECLNAEKIFQYLRSGLTQLDKNIFLNLVILSVSVECG